MTAHEPCDTCNAPLAADQRYCVVCGTNRRHPDDPAARYLAQLRRPAVAAGPPVAAPRKLGDSRVVLAAIALLPVAAAAGVLVGNGGDKADPNLVAALKAQQAALSKAGPATATTAAAAPTAALDSTFKLKKGFVVQLQTLPFATTGEDQLSKAEDALKAKGAKALGVINPDDFTLKPGSGGDYVVYSGAFKTKAEASKALKKLKKDFADAKVVAVTPPKGGGVGSASELKGTIDANTKYQAHPTKQQETDGAKVVQDIQSKQGKDYVEQQQQLPDTIVIP